MGYVSLHEYNIHDPKQPVLKLSGDYTQMNHYVLIYAALEQVYET